jgi:hypothetical protein
MATIEVTLGDDGKITAVDQRSIADPQENVTWSFKNFTQDMNPQVVFIQVAPNNPTPGRLNPSPFFHLEALPGGGFRGTVRPGILSGLYIYEVFDGNLKIDWRDPLPNPPNGNGFFGGLDVPRH